MNKFLQVFLKVNKKKALEYIYNQYIEKVKRICYKSLLDKSQVQDTVQEIFLKIFENIDNFKFKSHISTWIYKISINHIINKNKKLDFWLELNENMTKSKFKINIVKNELEHKIAEALNELDEIDKKIFILREYEGIKYKEISKILDLKEGTVKSKMHYIKKKLAAILENYISLE